MGLTTSSGKVLTTKDAEADQAAWRRESFGRYVPPEPDWLKEMRRKKVHVINVGPWRHAVWGGSYGCFTIWECPLGEDQIKNGPPVKKAHGHRYSEMLEWSAAEGDWISPISSQMFQNVIDNEAAMRLDAGQKGVDFAWELLGEGRGQNMAFSLRHRGCLVIKGDLPTEDELIEARLELEEDCRQLVAEARELHVSNEPMAKQAIVPGRHGIAAEILQLTDEPWVVARNPEARKSCPICGTLSNASILKCPGCREYIFDREAYARVLAEQDAQLKALKKA